MIENVFINTFDGKILYGDLNLFPKDPEYPVHEFSSKKLTQLKINDLILSILYSKIDNFKAAKYVYDLKTFLESKIGVLNAKNINTNYFLILNLIENYNSFSTAPVEYFSNILNQNNVYVNIVESIYTVINSEGIILKNIIIGNILIKSQEYHSINLSFKNSPNKSLCFKTDYEMQKTAEKINVICQNVSEKRPVLFYQFISPQLFIKMQRKGNSLIFTSYKKITVKSLKIVIPLSSTIFHANLKVNKGDAFFDLEKHIVEWEIKDQYFENESIIINSLNYNTEDATNNKNNENIKIYFNIPNLNEGEIALCSGSVIENPATKIFTQYIFQDGCYEIEQ